MYEGEEIPKGIFSEAFPTLPKASIYPPWRRGHMLQRFARCIARWRLIKLRSIPRGRGRGRRRDSKGQEEQMKKPCMRYFKVRKPHLDGAAGVKNFSSIPVPDRVA
ncbi:hypothetical protein MRB53_005370 [Persea americana]|uniref:Uncharacterized protein n=1 Tax=Persea americana TaxID=3435 RepID=A0ACC2MEN6_PERAE|nr:hypothetical protein MRB53_005370 [Persea americana]